jgi:Transglycosylase SLT domain
MSADTDKEQIKSLIKRIASSRKEDPNLVISIVDQESRFSSFAQRYESQYPYLFHPDRFKTGLISLATEINAQKTSWGLGQVMGALAREQGHKGFFAELLIPEINIEHIVTRLATLRKITSEPAYLFAGYNGGFGAMRKGVSGLFKNQHYVNECLKNYENLNQERIEHATKERS